jgi:hypothetical protein
MTVVEEASRLIPKATLVRFEFDTRSSDGLAILKHAYVRQMRLQRGEVAAVRQLLAQNNVRDPGHAGLLEDVRNMLDPRTSAEGVPWDLLTAFETAPVPLMLPAATALHDAPAAGLRAFGAGLATLRSKKLTDVSVQVVQPRGGELALPASPPAMGVARAFLNRIAAANEAFDFNAVIVPIGMLNLERLEMTPAGVERGELIATIPLAPLEETAVTQKEWSVTSKEFTSIVTDSLETVSETGVTDNTELAQSTTSQIQHSNQFNITGTVSGGIPVISGSSTSGFTAQDASSQSATDSRKHAVSITQKASARAKQEHKVTISTTTVTGTSEATTRTLKNPSQTDPIRIDYFSLIRDWRVRLYRYGLRLTYDIVIPEPGGALRKAYAELDTLLSGVGPFVFNLPHADITDAILPGELLPHYLVLADRYQAQVPNPPEPSKTITVQQMPEVCPDRSNPCGVMNSSMTINVPDGYKIDYIVLDGDAWGYGGKQIGYGIIGTTFFKAGAQSDQEPFQTTRLISNSGGDFLKGAEGPQTLGVYMNDVRSASILLTVNLLRTAAAFAQWQSDVWDALYRAAQNQYYSSQQEITNRIAALQDQLNNVDTLTLRREESDEIMKNVLRFLLGIDFDLMPQEVLDAFKDAGSDVTHGVGFIGDERGGLGISYADWAVITAHEDVVRFINEAIEWENVVSFLYSYFWDIPESWDFIRAIKHPDPNRQAFLRAGSARVVLTIRKGWEERWVRYTLTGDPSGETTSPYLTIAQEIAAYDDRNYPGIPPANNAKSNGRLEDAVFTTCSANIQPSPGPVTIPVESSQGFVVGAQVLIDTYDSRQVQEAAQITAIPDGTHIVVANLANQHPGSDMPFPVLQPGQKGTLIAEWHEYTPTSGTDIAVTSNLATVA